MIRRACIVLLAAARLLAGCGGGGRRRRRHGPALGHARPRHRGARSTTTVPAGSDAARALRSKADVETRYGGRFVQSIDGIEGDLAGQHDWFWFVNGYEGDHQRRRLPAPRRRRRSGGTTGLVGRGDAAAGGRRRLPRAVPPRVGRKDSGRRSCAGPPGELSEGIAELIGGVVNHSGERGERARARARVGIPCPARRLTRGSGRVRARAARRRAAARRPVVGALPVRGLALSPVPAAALLAALAAAALLADRTISVAIIAAGLFALCLRAPRGRRWLYLAGTLVSGLVLFLFSPLVARYGGVALLGGAGGSGDRAARRHQRRALGGAVPAASGSSPSGSRSLRTRFCSTWTDCCSRAGGCAARCSPLPLRRASSRHSSATPPAMWRRSGVVGSRLRACGAAHASSRHSSRARSSGR